MVILVEPGPGWWVCAIGVVRNADRLRREREARGLITGEGDDALLAAMVAESGLVATIERLSLDGGFVARSPEGRRYVVASGEWRRTLAWSLTQGRLWVGDPGAVAEQVGRTADPLALWLWLATGVVPPPLTCFLQVSALAAGHWLEVDPVPVVRPWRAVGAPVRGRSGRPDLWRVAVSRAAQVAVARRLPADGMLFESTLDDRLAEMAVAKGGGAVPRISATTLRIEDGFAAHPVAAFEGVWLSARGARERFLAPRPGALTRWLGRFRADETGLDPSWTRAAWARLGVRSAADAVDPRGVWRLPHGPHGWAALASGRDGADVVARLALAPARLAGMQRVNVEVPWMAPELDDRLADVPVGQRESVLVPVFGACPPVLSAGSQPVPALPGLTRGGRLTSRWEPVIRAFRAGVVTE